MIDCDHCQVSSDDSVQCNYCQGKYCPDHRLPEAHDCDAVEFLTGSHQHFKNKLTGNIVTSRSDVEPPEPITPEHTVGSMRDPEYDSPPDVELKTKSRNRDSDNSSLLLRLFRELLGKVIV